MSRASAGGAASRAPTRGETAGAATGSAGDGVATGSSRVGARPGGSAAATGGALPDGFVYLDEAVPGVRWDAKYATSDNFTGAPVDGYLANRIVGTRELCAALGLVQAEAAALGLGVFVWDAYRPQRAVDRFALWAQLPEDGRTKRRFYPHVDKRDLFAAGYVAARSAHSRGGAVDLTLRDLATGALLDMGTGFDFMDPLSRHGAGGLDPVAARRRRLLRQLMEACGFAAYEPEWWHYTLVDEPYPDAYFDFAVE